MAANLTTILLSFQPVAGPRIGVVAFGHQARRQIAESGGSLGGGGMATAGIVLGWIGVGMLVMVAIGVVALGRGHALPMP